MEKEVNRKDYFSIELENSEIEPNCSPIYRNPSYSKGKLSNLEGLNANNLWELFVNSVNKYKDKKCLGTRKLNRDGTYGEYIFKSYEELKEEALNIGINIMKMDLCPIKRYEDNEYQKEISMMGILSKNREEWYLTEHACNAFGICLAPLYDTLGEENLKYILIQTQLKSLCITNESLDKIISIIERSIIDSTRDSILIKNLICFDDPTMEINQRAEKLNINLISFNKLREKVSKKDKELYKPKKIKPDDMCSIHFTSGTTGYPKGAVLTHRCFLACVKSSYEHLFSENEINLDDDAHLSYLPMAHIFERLIVMNSYYLGIPIGIFSGSVTRLMSDSQELRPTILVCVPQVLTRIIQTVNEKISHSNFLVRTVFRKALTQKESIIKTKGDPTHWLWDRIIFSNTRQILGGRLKAIISGAAPLGLDINHKIQAIFCCRLIEGFGMSECIGTLGTKYSYAHLGTVGGPFSDVEVKLTSVLEMGYDSTKEPRRGLLKIRGNSVCKGYFRDSVNSKELIDDKGWLDTGDIAERQEDGSFKIIDRKKSLFKLSQGEYISPERIEGIYLSSSPLIQQVYVYGKSTDRFLVALVFPNEQGLRKWSKNKGINDSLPLEELCELPELFDELNNSFHKAELSSNLFGFERIHQFKVIPEIMSTSNGLLTPTMKIAWLRVIVSNSRVFSIELLASNRVAVGIGLSANSRAVASIRLEVTTFLGRFGLKNIIKVVISITLEVTLGSEKLLRIKTL
ncbi:acyl-synthetase [Cryptosporidium ubiquitum]|uniref:Acyl-synthetase n=1 Tax=Cryptosporidium ubiquitum TaxID=857276 RepID=A0A1J4MFW8_9CRYT|nr:acyl-synthetase [Cryptosporidium ubiquitum]OII72903.1 acyl-synthetase [Cryptosporidium ubiquitum]